MYDNITSIVSLAIAVVSLIGSSITVIWAWQTRASEVKNVDSDTTKKQAETNALMLDTSRSMMEQLRVRVSELETLTNAQTLTLHDLSRKLDVRGGEIVVLQRQVVIRDERISALDAEVVTQKHTIDRMAAQVEFLRGRNLLLENWAERLAAQIVGLGAHPVPLEENGEEK